MEYTTNCKNCGSPLHYDETNYGKTAICKYCSTEYHIDLLGRVEEYKIKIEIMGEIKEYYIGEMKFEQINIGAIGRDINGRLYAPKPLYKTKLNLIEI